jgi:hypothetical protein
MPGDNNPNTTRRLTYSCVPRVSGAFRLKSPYARQAAFTCQHEYLRKPGKVRISSEAK